MNGELYPGEFEAMEHNGRMDALDQDPWEDWCDVPSNEMTLEQARQAVKDLRKKLVEYLEQEPCPDTISRSDMLDAVGHGTTYTSEDLQKIIKGLPSVNPQPKIGKWIEKRTYMECPHCHDIWHYENNQTERFKCCPTCGERIK